MTKFLCVCLALAFVTVTGCVSEAQQLDKQQDEAIGVAVKRAQFDMGCPEATGQVLSREMIQPAVGIRLGGVERAEYTVGVSGCDKRSTLVVVCPVDGQGCFAADGR